MGLRFRLSFGAWCEGHGRASPGSQFSAGKAELALAGSTPGRIMAVMSSASQVETISPSWEAIVAAHQRIAPRIHRTPVLTSESLSKVAGAQLYLKCDNFQKTGSFKIR